MANSTVPQCSKLTSRTDFTDYIKSIKVVTGNKFSLIDSCRPEICNALWGSGNPDISGTGMISGYILQSALGFTFALALFSLQRAPRKVEEDSTPNSVVDHLSTILAKGYSSFYDCAIFLTFSIQIASIVVLARLDFGVSASGMGDITAKITWAVSLLTMLPLMHVAFIPNPMYNRLLEHRSKQNLRFLLFAVCWLLSLYPFYSKMMGYFGPTLIGNGPNHAISDEDWGIIEATCTANIESASTKEIRAMEFFGVAGSLILSICTLLKIIWLGAQRQHKTSKFAQILRKCRPIQNSKLPVMFLTIPPILAISQIWTILRLRQFQAQISNNTGNVDFDGEWTFGQVVRVTVFVPVVVECWLSWQND
ncbi:MAG: hypothetical protein Q9214_003125 [Letrouitia sp. 1 TL-2023]